MKLKSITDERHTNLDNVQSTLEADNVTLTDSHERDVKDIPEDTQVLSTFSHKSLLPSSTVQNAMDDTYNYATNEKADLNKFLSRPVRLASYKWDTGQGLVESFNPWTTYCYKEMIRKKLANYRYFRGRLHLRFVMNCNPFFYGAVQIAYIPAPFNQKPLLPSDALSASIHLMNESQKLHVILDTHENQEVDLVIPYTYTYNYMDLERLLSFSKGTIQLRSFNYLGSANGTNGDVTVTVFGWLEDVTLTAPTAFSLQSDQASTDNLTKSSTAAGEDEYGKSNKGKLSNAVRYVAEGLKKLPQTPAFATATTLAETGAGVLSYLGYSKPTNVEPTHTYRPTMTGELANANIADSTYKLTFDAKAETTISSEAGGFANNDEMLISTIASKWSYITQYSWNTGQVTDHFIGYCSVTPNLYRLNLTYYSDTECVVQHSPMSHLAGMFKYWSGSIKYRLSFLTSKYHSGKIAVVYSPDGVKPANTADLYATNYTYFVDIESTRSFEFTVSWMNNKPYLLLPFTTSTTGHLYGTSVDSGQPVHEWTDNGRFYIIVVNELNAPDVGAHCTILLHAAGGPDLEFFQPVSDKYQNATFLIEPTPPPEDEPDPPLADVPEAVPMTPKIKRRLLFESTDAKVTNLIHMIGEPEVHMKAKRSMVHHGDPILSLKQLLTRYDNTFGDAISANLNNNNSQFSRVVLPLHPWLGRYSGYGKFSANSGVINDYGVNHSVTTHLAYVATCFLGRRGAIKCKVMVHGSGAWKNSMVSLYNSANETIGSSSSSIAHASWTSTTFDIAPVKPYRDWVHTFSGESVTECGINPIVEAEFPYYSIERFDMRPLSSWDLFHDNMKLDDASAEFNRRTMTLFIINNYLRQPNDGDGTDTAHIRLMQAAGEDYNLLYYQGPPPMMYNTDSHYLTDLIS